MEREKKSVSRSIISKQTRGSRNKQWAESPTFKGNYLYHSCAALNEMHFTNESCRIRLFLKSIRGPFQSEWKTFRKGVVFNDPRFPYLSASLLKNRTVALSRWLTRRGRGTKGFSTRTENSWLHRFYKTVIIECFSNGFSKEKKWDRDVLLEFRRLEFG